MILAGILCETRLKPSAPRQSARCRKGGGQPTGAPGRRSRRSLALASSTALGATLQFSVLNAYADRVWLESDSTAVKQLSVTSGYPNKESCLLKISMPVDNDGGTASFAFSLLQIAPISPFSYADKAAQWSNNELIQLQVDGNRPIINQAHIDEQRGLSGLLIIPSSHLAEQMSRGRTLTVTTRAGVRTFPIPTDAIKAFQQCASALAKRK